MNTYSIEADGNGGYQVRVTGPRGDNDHIVAGFAIWRQAQEWIDSQIRIAMQTDNASDVA
jgi:hypothetical protein